MAIDFSGNWGDEIADVAESPEYQTCQIRVEWGAESKTVYDFQTNEMFTVKASVSDQATDTILSFHELQRVLSDPLSTPEEEQAAQDAYDAEAALLKSLVNASPAAEVLVSDTEPMGLEGDLWLRLVDRQGVVFLRGETEWGLLPTDFVVYSGPARYIPIRAAIWQGGEAQANATSIRAVRFQIPRSHRGVRIHSGAIVTIIAAPFNGSLVGRTAKVNDDFQGSTTATRTFHAMMDADSEDA